MDFNCNLLYWVMLQESLTGVVDLGSLNICEEVDICEKVLEFIYNGESVIDMASAGHLLAIAQMMQIRSLTTACLNFLLENLDKTNCIVVWQTAATHDFAELEARALSLVKKHFQEICDSGEFLELCKVDYILAILKGENLNCPDKNLVCLAALSWIHADLDNRADYFEDVLEALFALPVSVQEIEEAASTAKFIGMQENPSYKQVIQTLRDRHSVLLPTRHHPSQLHMLNDEAVVVVGGCEDGTNQDVQCFSFPQKKWFKLTSLPNDVGFEFAVCSYGTDMFVSGGTTRMNAFYHYDGERNSWEDYPNLPSKRQRHCTAVVRNTLYVLGGRDTPQSSPHKYIDAFDLMTRTWRTGGKTYELPTPVRSASCAVHRQNIYIIGGIDAKGTQVNRVQCFNAKDHWSYEEYQILPDIPNFQYHAVVVNDQLYIVSKNGEVLLYKPGDNNKRPAVIGQIPTPYFPRKDCGVCEFENNILIIGGVVKFQPRKDMIQFNIEKKLTFSMDEVMPSPKRQFGMCKTTVLRSHLSNVDD